MKNFIFKSTDADLQKIVSVIVTDLNILKKNTVYSTYKLDAILKLVQQQTTDNNLQKQVDDYFEEDEKIIPEEKED